MTATAALSPGTNDCPVSWWHPRWRALLRGFRTHQMVYLLSVWTFVAGMFQSYLLGRPMALGLADLANNLVLLLIAAIICVRLLIKLVALWRSGHEGSPARTLWHHLLEVILTPGQICNGTHVFFATSLFAMGFTNIKANIPLVNPFSWDEALMKLDRALHLGVLPHDLLMPVFGYPLVTALINLNYKLWIFVMIGFLLWQGYRDRDTALRQQFLITFALVWIIGTAVLGTIFSSAGPCFYGRLVPGSDPYQGLMTYLRSANAVHTVLALGTQDALWTSYVTSRGTISGISAMPSMHVASSVLFFLCARAAGIRWLTWASGIFAILIFLGSILLGWHYAVDGYAGAAIALLCWWLAGQWVSRQQPVSSRPSSGRR